jgi:hypothetical protein
MRTARIYLDASRHYALSNSTNTYLPGLGTNGCAPHACSVLDLKRFLNSARSPMVQVVQQADRYRALAPQPHRQASQALRGRLTRPQCHLAGLPDAPKPQVDLLWAAVWRLEKLDDVELLILILTTPRVHLRFAGLPLPGGNPAKIHAQ